MLTERKDPLDQTPVLQNDEDARLHLLKEYRVIVRIWTSCGNPDYPGETVGHISIETTTPPGYMSLWPKQQLTDENGNPLLNQETGALISAKERDGLGIFSGITGEFLPNFKKDLEYEGRPPEVVHCFYTLDSNVIVAYFDALKSRHAAWALIPGVTDSANSCSSLAWKLLQEGGIRKLLSMDEMSSIASRGSSKGVAYASGAGTHSSKFFKGSASSSVDVERKIGSKEGSFYSSEMLTSFIIKSPDAVQQFLKAAKEKELGRNPLTVKILFDTETKVNPPVEKSTFDCSIS